MRKNDLKNILSKSKSRDKDYTMINVNNNLTRRNNLLGSNISTNRSYNKTKLVKKNQKVKFSFPINIKSNKLKSINKSCKNIGSIIGNNYQNSAKKNVIHRHTKSSFIQGTNLLLMKDTNITYINNNLYNNESQSHQKNMSQGKKNSLNNFLNYNTKMVAGNKNKKNKNEKIASKLNKNRIQNFQGLQKNNKKELIKYDFMNSYREPNKTKDGLDQIIEELKSESRNSIDSFSNIGLTKKFIDAQNNWRKNYFATVIQKLFRGYYYRKNYHYNKLNKKLYTNSVSSLSTNSKETKNTHINSMIYIKKKAKDSNYLSSSAIYHKDSPFEEKNKFIKYNKTPHKIKEIIISLKSKKDYLNKDIYYNNYMIPNFGHNQNYHDVKYVFDLWKEKKDKIEILKKLKILKKYKKNLQRRSSYEKQRKNARYQI